MPESTLGPHFVGVVLTTIFYGITLAQTFAYFRAYATDPRLMKLLVVLLLVLDTTQVSLVFASIYGYAVQGRDDDTALQYVSKPFIASMGVTSAVAFTVQMIYAYRVWRLSGRNLYLTSTIVSLAFIALGSSTVMTTKTLRHPRWDQTRVSNLPAGIILASTVTCDLFIAFSQVWLFHRHRLARLDGRDRFPLPLPISIQSFSLRRSGSSSIRLTSPTATTTEAGRRSTDKSLSGAVVAGSSAENDGCRLGGLITTLTVLVINVGLLTSIDASVFLALFLTIPQSGLYLVPYILLSNCYVNSFLSILNSRRELRDLVENPTPFDFAFAAPGSTTVDPFNPDPCAESYLPAHDANGTSTSRWKWIWRINRGLVSTLGRAIARHPPHAKPAPAIRPGSALSTDRRTSGISTVYVHVRMSDCASSTLDLNASTVLLPPQFPPSIEFSNGYGEVNFSRPSSMISTKTTKSSSWSRFAGRRRASSNLARDGFAVY
ncbi:hypothetical protein MKEN_00153100 [Mycena kentingensis (nom. inval.)]|nr:hypothetical protein MKEN_00153100 [Mycena kentingensis (nom. inval.)]